MILVADIERGGVIANLVGTWHLLDAEERAHTAGYIINKFRGDPSLFDDGLKRISQETGLRSFGVLPWFDDAAICPPKTPWRSDDTAKLAAAIKFALRFQCSPEWQISMILIRSLRRRTYRS